MDDLEVGRYAIPGTELEETFHTSGGPGGQHANRSESAVRLRFNVAGSSLPSDVRDLIVSRLGNVVEVTASDERSQARNRVLARHRLRERLELAIAPPKRRRRTRRTRASNERRLDRKRRRAQKKRGRRRPGFDD